jgi:NAD(P) transhydrogenase subunit beta
MILSASALSGLFFILVFFWGIRLMQSPRTAVRGNLLGALGMLGAIASTLVRNGIVGKGVLWGALAVGGALGYVLAVRATMIKMPQIVALLNGFGGLASSITAFLVLAGGHTSGSEGFTAALALAVGAVTFSGSMVAAGKLDHRISQRPLMFRGHTGMSAIVIVLVGLLVVFVPLTPASTGMCCSSVILVAALGYGVLFAARIGGADMPITISLLNSLSGVAGSITGFAVRDPLLVAVGAIVGSAGLILTRIMCHAMNRTLSEVVLGKTTISDAQVARTPESEDSQTGYGASERAPRASGDENDSCILSLIRSARNAIIVPGYGMALSQAQHRVKELFNALESSGKEVKFAIHPVAGRMPGHMNVLLAEADVPYERLYEMDAVNPLFADTDVVFVIGANDVINPAAATAVGTPLYGMPILNVHKARNILVFNKDTLPGYAGVGNPLYTRENVFLFLGDAAEQLGKMIDKLTAHGAPAMQ